MSARRPPTIKEAVQEARNLGQVPFGILVYDVEKDSMQLTCIAGIDPAEVAAILKKFGIRFAVK